MVSMLNKTNKQKNKTNNNIPDDALQISPNNYDLKRIFVH